MVGIEEVYRTYVYNPINFVWPIFIFFILSLLAFLSALFLYINANIFLNFFGVDYYIVLTIFSLLFLYVLAGFYGGVLKGFKLTYETKKRIGFEEFLKYSKEKSLHFFLVFLIKIVVNLLIIAIFYHFFINQQFPIQIVGIFLFVPSFFVLNYFLYFVSIGMVIYEGIGFVRAFTLSLFTSLHNILYLISSYIMHVIVLPTFLLPFFNLFSFFIFYPVVETFAIARMKKVMIK